VSEVTFYLEELYEPATGQLAYRFVPKTLDVAGDFQIDESNIEGELCRMGQLIACYGEIQANLKAALARREDAAKREWAAAFLRFQQAGKTTVDALKAQAETDPAVQAANVNRRQFEEQFAKIDNYFKALLRKCDCLTALTYKIKAEFQRGDRG